MNLRRFTIQILILALVHSPFLNGASKLDVGDGQPALRQRIEQFGVGTELKVKLADGTKLRGLVEEIGKDSFLLVAKDDGASREIAYNELDKLSYPKRGYKAEGTPDAAAAKRMVVQLGVGEHIMVKVGPTQKVRGHIREINDAYFVVQPDGQTQTLQVPYNNIWKINKNLSFGATIAIVVGIAAAVILILVLSGEEEVDVLPN
jgi:hypothetical protein